MLEELRLLAVWCSDHQLLTASNAASEAAWSTYAGAEPITLHFNILERLDENNRLTLITRDQAIERSHP